MKLPYSRLLAIGLALVLSIGAAIAEDKPASRESAKKKLLLLAQKPDGHPPTTHEYVAGLTILKSLLAKTPQIEAEIVSADSPWTEGPGKLQSADGAVLFLAEGARWVNEDPRRLEAFARLAQKGGGLCVLHWGMGTREAKNIDGFVKLFGACHGGPDRKYTVIELEAQPSDHPIATGVRPFKVKDEFYYALKRVQPAENLHAVLRVPIDGQEEMVAWAWERDDGGRSFGFSGLHFHENWKLEPYRRMVLQGVLWSLKLEIPKEGVDVSIEEKLLELPAVTAK